MGRQTGLSLLIVGACAAWWTWYSGTTDAVGLPGDEVVIAASRTINRVAALLLVRPAALVVQIAELVADEDHDKIGLLVMGVLFEVTRSAAGAGSS